MEGKLKELVALRAKLDDAQEATRALGSAGMAGLIIEDCVKLDARYQLALREKREAEEAYEEALANLTKEELAEVGGLVPQSA